MYDHRRKVEPREDEPWDDGARSQYITLPVTKAFKLAIEEASKKKGANTGSFIRRILWKNVMMDAINARTEADGVNKGKLARRLLWEYVMGEKKDG